MAEVEVDRRRQRQQEKRDAAPHQLRHVARGDRPGDEHGEQPHDRGELNRAHHHAKEQPVAFAGIRPGETHQPGDELQIERSLRWFTCITPHRCQCRTTALSDDAVGRGVGLLQLRRHGAAVSPESASSVTSSSAAIISSCSSGNASSSSAVLLSAICSSATSR